MSDSRAGFQLMKDNARFDELCGSHAQAAQRRIRGECDMSLARETVNRFLALQREMYAGGSPAGLEGLLAENVRWHVPGRSPIAGDYSGRPAVLDYFHVRRTLAGGAIVIRKRDEMHDEEVVVQLADGSATVDSITVSWRTVGAYRVADGRIAEAWLVPLDLGAFDEIWCWLGERRRPGR